MFSKKQGQNSKFHTPGSVGANGFLRVLGGATVHSQHAVNTRASSSATSSTSSSTSAAKIKAEPSALELTTTTKEGAEALVRVLRDQPQPVSSSAMTAATTTIPVKMFGSEAKAYAEIDAAPEEKVRGITISTPHAHYIGTVKELQTVHKTLLDMMKKLTTQFTIQYTDSLHLTRDFFALFQVLPYLAAMINSSAFPIVGFEHLNDNVLSYVKLEAASAIFANTIHVGDAISCLKDQLQTMMNQFESDEKRKLAYFDAMLVIQDHTVNPLCKGIPAPTLLNVDAQKAKDFFNALSGKLKMFAVMSATELTADQRVMILSDMKPFCDGFAEFDIECSKVAAEARNAYQTLVNAESQIQTILEKIEVISPSQMPVPPAEPNPNLILAERLRVLGVVANGGQRSQEPTPPSYESVTDTEKMSALK